MILKKMRKSRTGESRTGETIFNFINSQKIRWLGHVCSMENRKEEKRKGNLLCQNVKILQLRPYAFIS